MVFENIERNLGEQPIKNILEEHHISVHDIVVSSTQQITHKMVSKAMKGRRITIPVQIKILKALNHLTQKDYSITDLFNYS